MSTRKNKKLDKIAEAIGASRVIHLTSKTLGGPLDWLQLAQKLQTRLISRGGRPSDPHWNTKRLVPFRSKTWKRLAREAEAISAEGRKVGPAQLAAIVIEECLTVAKQGTQFYVMKSEGLLPRSSDAVRSETKLTLDPASLPVSEIEKPKTEWIPNEVLLISNQVSLVS